MGGLLKPLTPRFASIFIVFLLLVETSAAQQWKRYREEAFAGIGFSNFLGELGGADREGSNFVRDLELAHTRPALAIGYRYAIGPYSRLRSSLYWGMLRGADSRTEEPFRNNRNLHFRSGVTELSIGYEHYFLQEGTGHRYNIIGARGMKTQNLTFYVHGSVAAIYFNPKAEYNGKWVALQPLGTEGQGIKPGTKKYSRFNFAIPFGLGAKYAIDRNWRIGLELGLRKTFTDYLDDVSTEYYNNNAIRAANGDVAGDLADPNKNMFTYQLDDSGYTREGLQRGDPSDKDSYMFAVFTVNYRIARRGSRAKF